MSPKQTELSLPEDAMRRLAEMKPGQATSLFTSDPGIVASLFGFRFG